jgi:hypothetical protein
MPMKNACRAVAAAVVLLSVPLALLASIMKQTVTAIAVPKDTATIRLQDLSYGVRLFTAEVKTVRLDPMPAANADPVEADWVFTGNNTDGQIHRVSITLTLIDESSKRLISFGAKTVLRPGAKDQLWSVHMKVPAKVWTATRTIRIAADWFS